MQLINIFYLVFLMICVVTTCVKAGYIKQDLTEKKVARKITKRDASIIVDNFPLESSFSKKPKVIYRRVSKQKYRGPKSKYGAPKVKYGPPTPKYGPPKMNYSPPTPISMYGPPRPKYGPPKPGRNVYKKYKKSKRIGPKYGNKKRSPKPKYGPPKISKTKSTRSPPKSQTYYSYNPPEPIGFGEPPSDYTHDLELPRPTSGEPPVDSYGAPLTSLNEAYPTAQGDPYSSVSYEGHKQVDQPPPQNIDTSYDYSKQHSIYVKPGANVFDDPLLLDYNDNVHSQSYSDIFKYGQNHQYHNISNKKRKPQLGDKYLNKPWKSLNFNGEGSDDDQIVVGGQYAEPPARYLPKMELSPSYFADEDFALPNSFVDSTIATSATVSPYVNYKNSNMAFSPQNLNDAFSIIDK